MEEYSVDTSGYGEIILLKLPREKNQEKLSTNKTSEG